MPQQLTPETRERYLRALAMRDAGCTFREIAEACGYADAGTARYAWIGGLRLAGRHSDIPTRTPRTVRVQIGNQVRAITVDSLESWTTISDITFGIELECVGLNIQRAANVVSAGGYNCTAEGYTHQTMPRWKAVTDGSLSSRSGGAAEVVSPVLNGNDGLTEIRTVAKLLREGGARVNESCGMHIHLGVDQMTVDEQCSILETYAKWQWAFTALVRERRVNGRWSQLRTMAQWNDLVTEWRHDNGRTSRYNDRYYALNVASFHRHGTFEMRSHHGSLNGTNACAWIALHQAFFDAARTGHSLVTTAPWAAKWERRTTTEQHVLQTGELVYEVVDQYGARNLMSQAQVDSANALVTNNPTAPQYTIIGPAMRTVRHEPTRQEAVESMRELLRRLVDAGFLEQGAASYLAQRAGNIPTNNRNS
jgi:hypothetical protein